MLGRSALVKILKHVRKSLTSIDLCDPLRPSHADNPPANFIIRFVNGTLYLCEMVLFTFLFFSKFYRISASTLDILLSNVVFKEGRKDKV